MAKPNVPNKNTGDTLSAAECNSIVQSIDALYDGKGGVLEFPEISISHTNGVVDSVSGTTTTTAGGIGAGYDGVANLTLSPASTFWGTLNYPLSAQGMSCYSNVLPADLAGTTLINRIEVEFHNAYLTTSTGATTGARQTIEMSSAGIVSNSLVTGGANAIGVLNSPPLVKDSLTLFATAVQDPAYPSPNDYQIGTIGTSGSFSRFYFIFRIGIPASAATKVYKFKLFLSYQ